MTLLGVKSDALKMTTSMPQAYVDELKMTCMKFIHTKSGDLTTLDSLVGRMTWAASCIPQASTFVAAVRHRVTAARAAHQSVVQLTRRAVSDLRWWVTAIDEGLATGGISYIPVKVEVVHIFKGDAGSEWHLQQ